MTPDELLQGYLEDLETGAVPFDEYVARYLDSAYLAGPLKADVAYQARTRILKLTESPKTENVWYDVFFTDPASGTEVAYVRYLLRALKNSSPHYAAG